jgi:hypothetical protein
MTIDTSKLSREIKDRIELKADSEMSFYRATEEDYTDELMTVLGDRGKPGSNHSFIASCFGTQGSGKSYLSMTLCKILDPNFTVDNIYFDYRDLIYNRANLKPGSAVMVDEQSEEYGIDSHRINIILGALKEQLRKKSIHFIFCAPVLKDEYHSSMYVIETMFIDYKEKVCYAAYKTRDLLTLGYVKIPHPMNFLPKEFIEEYELKKDAHLDKLTGVKQVDEIEEIADKVVASELFVRAEAFYVKKIGYISASMVVQIINKLYPEFKSSIIVGEVAARIKLNKELDGKWKIPYMEKKKKKI